MKKIWEKVKSGLSWCKKQLISKTGATVILSVLFYVLKAFGFISEVPSEFGLGVTATAVLNVIIKIIKTWYYKNK